jgi:hypothetical protein
MDANTNSPTLRSQTAFVDSSSAHTTKATEKGKRKSLLRTSKTTVMKHQATASGLSSALSLVGDIPGRSFGASRSGGLFSWKNGKW